MRAAALLWVLLTAGCSGGPRFVCDPPGNVTSGGEDQGHFAPLGEVGTAVALEVRLGVSACSSSTPWAQPAVEVLDAENRRLPQTASALTHAGSRYTTTVQFTPAAPGPHHVTVVFEPGLARHQLDVHVVAERTAPPVTQLSLGAACEALEPHPLGTLCQRGNTLALLDGATERQQWRVDGFAVAGPVVWMLSGAQLSRWVAGPGAALVQEPAAPLDGFAIPGAVVVAGDSSALLVNGGRVQRVWVEAGTLLGDEGVAFKVVGDDVAVSARADLSAVLVVGRFRACTVQLGATPRADCTEAAGRPLGGDSAGVWSLEETTLVHRGWGETTGAPAQREGLTFRSVASVDLPSRHYPGAPVLWADAGRQHQLVPAARAGVLVLERYPLEDGFVLVPGSATMVRAQAADGRQLLFGR